MTQLTFPGIVKPDDIARKSDFAGKTVDVLLPHSSVEERIDTYNTFCHAWDKREDSYLRDEYQMFSHRLHWQDHPYVEAISSVTSLREKVWLTLVFSFTNEHWQTFMTLLSQGEAALKKRIQEDGERVQRNDLFQIYYPKGTKVKEWIIDGTKKAADEMYAAIGSRNKRWGMMNLAYEMNSYFRANQRFNTALYPSKNFARYLAMGTPSLVNPESYVHPGTGSFRGLHQIFGGKYLMSSARYTVDEDGDYVALNKAGEELKRQFDVLSNHPGNPITEMRQLNHEDKACFFFKRLCLETGLQKPTPRIPYTYIFPEEFSLRVPA